MGLTMDDFQKAGGGPLVTAFVLWVLVAGTSLPLIKFGGLHLQMSL